MKKWKKCVKHDSELELNVWHKFTKDTPLKTNDILLIKTGNYKELAFVDSGVTYGGPDRIMSMPEAWSFGLDWQICETMFKKCRFIFPPDDISPNKDNCYMIIGTSRFRNIHGEYCFTVEKFMRVEV